MTCTHRFLVTTPLACILLSGCMVATHSNGSNKNVSIGTPFGSMKVKTDNTTDTSAIGLEAYPGAVPVADSNDKHGNAANVDMSFGNFHLGVKAAFFQTSDPQDKVLTFYGHDLASRFGDVIECRGNQAIGSPAKTAQGLTCGDQKPHEKFNVQDSGNHIELRTGSAYHQHIVTVEHHNGGTKIGLVYLDLPSKTSSHSSDDSE